MVRGHLHGIARYALELAHWLPRLEPQWQFQGLMGPQGMPDGLGHLTPRIPLVSTAAAFLAPVEQPLLAATLFTLKPDLFHATSFSLPALWPGRLVATLHDANHLAVPESASATRAAYYHWVVRPRASRAPGLITVSEFSRRELQQHLRIDSTRVQVIPNGVDPMFAPVADAEKADFRQRRGLPEKYLAVIGNLKRFKNLALLKPVAARFPHPLALLAGRGARRALDFTDATYELAPLPDEDLVRFYGSAQAVLVPSRYEGFGLPALEALACGAPVLASDAGAHPEVLKDAALLVSADDATAWVKQTTDLLQDEARMRELVEKGRARAASFTWERCARMTRDVYRRVLGLF
ncbi:MAG: glycosyltransferase family 4 protein [Myxococcaceae bacterium]|nr:glycosyltransferase family 4 protein [Myxococcaceae bacterium]